MDGLDLSFDDGPLLPRDARSMVVPGRCCTAELRVGSGELKL